MPRVWRVVPALLAVAVLAGAARADEQERGRLLRAFAELRAQAASSLSGVKLRSVDSAVLDARGRATVASREAIKEGMIQVKPATVDVQGERVRTTNMVKVWGELAAGGKKVSLSGYEWRPNERFYLCFETTAPVRFAFHQTDPGKEPILILPKPKHTKSYETIMPGKPYKLPVLLKMLDTDDDEVVTLSVVVVGSGPDPDPVGDDNRIGVKPADDYCQKMDALFRSLVARKVRMKPLDIVRSGRASSDNPDDVALIAVGADKAGTIQLTMRKAR